jgi:hypothetical protein
MGEIRVIVLFLLVLSGKFAYEIFNTEFQVRYLIFMVMILVSIGPKLIYTNLQRGTSINAVIAFCSTLILSAGWNMEGSYVLEYILDLFLMIFSVLCVTIFLKNSNNIFLFLGLFEKTAFIYSVLSIASVFMGERGSLLFGGPNVTVRIIFLGILCHMVLRRNQNYNYLLIFIFIAGVIATGSRGGLISSLICLTLYIANTISLRSMIKFFKIRIVGIIKMVIFSATLLYIYDNFSNQIASLISSRITETIINKIHLAGRDDLLISSFKVIGENAYFGQGLASYYDNEVGFHPHNLIVQLYLDMGLLSFINIAIILYALRIFFVNRKSIVFYAIPFFCIAHLVSGSYYDLRYMFIFWILGQIMNKDKLIAKDGKF